MINPIFVIDNIIFDVVFLIWHRGALVPYNIQIEDYGYFRPTLRYKDSLIMFVDTKESAELFVSSHEGFYFTVLRNMRVLPQNFYNNVNSKKSSSCKC